MTNVNFGLRNPKEDAEQSIWARFYFNGKEFKVKTNLTVHPDNWNSKKQEFKSDRATTKLLGEQQDFIGAFIDKLKVEKKPFFLDELREDFNTHFCIGEIITKEEKKEQDFITFINDYIDSRRDLSASSKRVLISTKQHILLAHKLVPEKMRNAWNKMSVYDKKHNPNFLQANKVVFFDEINYDWIDKIHEYFYETTYSTTIKGKKVEEHYAQNTIAKYIIKTKMFCDAASRFIKDKSYQDFKGEKIKEEDSDSIALTWDEIKAIGALKLEKDSMVGMVRNIFIFNCYCGMRYSDFSRIEQDMFEVIKGELIIDIGRVRKTGEPLAFPILPQAQKVLKMYDGSLPSVSANSFNEEIKKIGEMAGINKIERKNITRAGKDIEIKLPRFQMMSSHTGRRTFATNFFNTSIPVKLLMQVTGHKKESSFLIYVKRTSQPDFSVFRRIGATL